MTPEEAREKAAMIVDLVFKKKNKPGISYPRKAEWRRELAQALLSTDKKAREEQKEKDAKIADAYNDPHAPCLEPENCSINREIATAIRGAKP